MHFTVRLYTWLLLRAHPAHGLPAAEMPQCFTISVSSLSLPLAGKKKHHFLNALPSGAKGTAMLVVSRRRGARHIERTSLSPCSERRGGLVCGARWRSTLGSGTNEVSLFLPDKYL